MWRPADSISSASRPSSTYRLTVRSVPASAWWSKCARCSPAPVVNTCGGPAASVGAETVLLDRQATLAAARFGQRSHDHEDSEVERRARARRIDTLRELDLSTPGADLPVATEVMLVLLRILAVGIQAQLGRVDNDIDVVGMGT